MKTGLIFSTFILISSLAHASGLQCKSRDNQGDDNLTISVSTLGDSVLTGLNIHGLDQDHKDLKFSTAVYDDTYKPTGPRKMSRFIIMENANSRSNYALLIPPSPGPKFSAVLVEFDGSWGNSYFSINCTLE